MRQTITIYLLLIFLLISCKSEQQERPNKINQSEAPTAQQDHIPEEAQPQEKQTATKQADKTAWQTISEPGFYFSGFAGPGGSKEYNEALEPITESELAYSITPISIEAITTGKIPKDYFGKEDNCRWANFVKFKHSGSEKIVFGEHVYVPLKKHQGKEMSIWVVKNYLTGVGDDQGLTGCDRYHPILLCDKEGLFHTVHEDEEEAEEPMYISLVESDVAEDKIESIQEDNEVLTLQLVRSLQDGAQSYSIQIFQRDEIWWAKTSALQDTTDKRLAASTMSIEDLEDKALDKHLKAWNTASGNADPKLVASYIDHMKDLLSNHPESMDYPFRILVGDKALQTVSSSDNKLRFYNFNRQMGGTMDYFTTIYQTKVGGTVKTTEVKLDEGDSGDYVSEIHAVKGENNSYYIVIANQHASKRDIIQLARAYRIKNGELEPIKLFTKKKKAYHEIEVSYDFFSAMDKTNERPIPVIQYDSSTKKFAFALVNKNKEVTDKNLMYQWNGQEFEFQGVE